MRVRGRPVKASPEGFAVDDAAQSADHERDHSVIRVVFIGWLE
jgi:hypothetical protein